jgi:hypothetical protein
MIRIKQDEKTRNLEIDAANVTGIEYSPVDGCWSAEALREIGVSARGKLRELIIRMGDGSVIAITCYSNEDIPIALNEKLDVEAVVAELNGKPLPTVQDLADGVEAQLKRDSDPNGKPTIQ